MKSFLLFLIALMSVSAFSSDVRDKAILASPMVKAIQSGLQKEQRLKCIAVYDEARNLTVNYFVENNRSKFELFLDCNTHNGLNAVIKGSLGDGGQTAVESFRMQTGVN